MKLRYALVMAAIAAALTLSAATYEVNFNDGNFIYQYTDNRTSLKINPWPSDPNKTYTGSVYNSSNLSKTHYTGDIVIPSSYKYKDQEIPVTSINDFAFYYTEITSVDIPESVTSFGTSCLRQCLALTKITIRGQIAEMQLQDFMAFKEGRPDTEIILYSVVPPALTVDMTKINQYYPDNKLTIRVPAGSLAAYKADSNWAQLNLQPISGSEPVQYAIQELNMTELSKVRPVITANGEPYSADNLTWKSDDPETVYVASDGSLFSHNPGSTQIHCYQYDRLLASATANVSAKSSYPESSLIQLNVENVYPALTARFSMPLRQDSPQTLKVNTHDGWTLISASLGSLPLDISVEDNQQSIEIPALQTDADLRLEYAKSIQTGNSVIQNQTVVVALREGSSLCLAGLLPNSGVRVYTSDGMLVSSTTSHTGNATLPLGANGPYIVTCTGFDGLPSTLRLP